MALSTLVVADALAAQLVAAGVPALVDVAKLAANLPAVLIPPPRLENAGYAAATVSWRLLAVAADSTGGRLAWEQLDGLLGLLFDALPIEIAEPTTHPVGDQVFPAYALTFTGSAGF